MRPRSILWFERASLAAVFTAVLNVLAATEIGLLLNGADDAGAATVLFSSVVVILALVYRVSRRRSRLAKWILAAFTFILIFGSASLLLTRMDLARTIVGLAAVLTQLGGVALLFTPPARAWLAADAGPRETLVRTFE